MNGLDLIPIDKIIDSRVVVRVKTSTWDDKYGLHTKKSLLFLKRKCDGINFLKEDCSSIDAEHVMSHIENLDDCSDGIYEVIMCNVSHDFESGHVDNWDYRLIPYKELL